jgi:hypothetical protein
MFAEEEVDRVVQQYHLQIFSSWLGLSLEQQTADVTCFLAESAANQSETLKDWIDTRWYECLVPREARLPERTLFVSDLELVLLVMHAQTYRESPIATARRKRPDLCLAPDPS